MKPYDAVEQAYKRGFEDGTKDAKEAVERAYTSGLEDGKNDLETYYEAYTDGYNSCKANMSVIDAVKIIRDNCYGHDCNNCVVRDCFLTPCFWKLKTDDAETEEKSERGESGEHHE